MTNKGSLLKYSKRLDNGKLEGWGYTHGRLITNGYKWDIKDKQGNIVTQVDGFKEAHQYIEATKFNL